MENFVFYNPVRIFMGKDQIPEIAGQIASGSHVMIIYGSGSIFRNGVYDKIREALKEFKLSEFGGIEPNPLYETAMNAVAKIKEEKVDFLIAAGGGSVIDAVKFISAAAMYDNGDPWNILLKQEPVKAALPFGTILTLPATGSEMNMNSVINRRSTMEKFAFASPAVFPRFSVLTPEAAATLPPNQVANGIVDAFVHVLEQYLTYPVNAPIQDRFAEAILITLKEEGPKAYANPSDYEAMANLTWSATMALNGLISCGVPGDWSVHSIGHELTALHGIDHARTLAIILPGLWKTLKTEKGDKLLQYGNRIWNITEGSREERIEKTIIRTEEFFRSLGIKTKLSEYGIGRDTIDVIVQRFEKRKWFTLGDRGLTTPDVTRNALELQL